jgi:uncharacterized protein YlzI (FlbEa/FlbD family)
MKTFITKIVMDSGKEYVIEKHPEDVVNSFTTQMGVVKNGFIHFDTFSINPSHVSSVEQIEVEK